MLHEFSSLALIAAHPDDEVVGAGSQLPRLRDRISIAHVTDGAPRNMQDAVAYGFANWEDYAQARRDELVSALQVAGVERTRTFCFGVPDQQASMHLQSLAESVADFVERIRPEAILTHAYEGGHPDHDATAFAVHAGLAMLNRRGCDGVPRILEFTSYHAGPDGSMVTFEFLPPETEVITFELNPAEREWKRRMIECFRTQQKTLSAFGFEVERFRPAPRYDFTEAPHAGPLYYDNFSWGIASPRWLELAREALHRLGLEGRI